MTLEKASNVAVLFASVGILFQGGVSVFRGNGFRTASNTQKPSYVAGMHIKDTPDLSLASRDHTLVLVTNSFCHFCTASMPFYRSLIGIAHAAGAGIIGLTFENIATNQDYLSSNGVEPDRIASVTANGIAVHGTPSLLVIDRKGSVVKYWSGQLSAEAQSDVVQTIKKRWSE